MGKLSSLKEDMFGMFEDNSDGLGRSRKGVFFSGLSTSTVSIFTSGIFYTALLLIVLQGATEIEYGFFLALNTEIIIFSMS